MTYILSISKVKGDYSKKGSMFYSFQHEHATALIKDGKLVAMAEEERFSRVKHNFFVNPDKGYKISESMEFCLNFEGITVNDIDYFSFGKIIPPFDNTYSKTIKNKPPKIIRNKNMFFIPHHLAHSASTYRVSPYKSSAILNIDGNGDRETASAFAGEGNDISFLWDILDHDRTTSIGSVYEIATMLLGLGQFGQGKTMGLASYGQPSIDFSNFLNIKSITDWKIDNLGLRRHFIDLMRSKNAPFLNKHKDFAASLQNALEKSALKLADELYSSYKNKNLCMAGGVMLNCKMNSTLLEKSPFKNIFIQPAAHDAGCVLGAGMETYAQLGYDSKFIMEHPYFGPEFTGEQIKKALILAKLEFENHKSIPGVAAELLSKGNIIGWFQGRMEIGPRALGNRSILADPTSIKIRDRVNKLKGRELWRPLAPSILEGKEKLYFENPYPSPFMLLSFKIKDDKAKELEGVCHVDQTTRPQTVLKKTNPKYHALINYFNKEKGTPMVLNTSFNTFYEPIVCTPQDAIKTFKEIGLDYLCIGSFLVKNPKN